MNHKSNRLQNGSTLALVSLITAVICILELIAGIPNLATPSERVDLAGYDLIMRLRGVQTPSAPIVIIAIDDASFNYTGYRWPWPRAYLAQIVDILNQAGAKVIGLDVFLFESDSEAGGDEALAKTLQSSRAAVSVLNISRGENFETLDLPAEIYHDVLKNYGISGIISDDDAIVRSIQAYDYSAYNQHTYLNWAIATAKLYLGEDLSPDITPDTLQINGKSVPLYQQRMFIDYIGPPETFPYYSAHQVVLGDFPPETFKDKIVLIGATSITLQDLYPTPYSATLRTPGVEVIANAIHTLISGNFYYKAPPLLNMLVILLAAGNAWLISRKKQPIRALILMSIAILVLIVLWALVFLQFRWQFSLTLPLATILVGVIIPTLLQVVNEEIEKRRLRSLFSRFISPEMVDQIIKTQDISSLNKRTELTILFSDIRNFTSLSEKLAPEEVVGLLNPFLSAMTRVIHKNGGTVDKYEGDAILAFFGEPIPLKDHARRAVQTALEMQRELEKLRHEWSKQQVFEGQFEIGIGINTGEVFVGMLGSEQRVNYTVIGDNVNLAARLQDLTKLYNTPILISGKTYEQVQEYFKTEFLETTQIKGKSEPVRIYRILF